MKESEKYVNTSLDGSVENTVDESSDTFGREVSLFWGEFGHVLFHVDDTHVWARFFSDSEEFHDALVVFDIAINQDVQEFAFELLGGLGVSGQDGVVVRGRLGSEQEVVLLFLGSGI